jgi:hypothetical protein
VSPTVSPMNTRKACLAAGPLGVSLSAVLIIASLLLGRAEPIDTVLFRIGMAVMALAGTVWVVARSNVSAEMVERARQQGWDDGYENGLTDARPTNVVPLDRSSLRLPLSPDGPPQEFAQ